MTPPPPSPSCSLLPIQTWQLLVVYWTMWTSAVNSDVLTAYDCLEGKWECLTLLTSCSYWPEWVDSLCCWVIRQETMATCLGRHDRPTPDRWNNRGFIPHLLWEHHFSGKNKPHIQLSIISIWSFILIKLVCLLFSWTQNNYSFFSLGWKIIIYVDDTRLPSMDQGFISVC